LGLYQKFILKLTNAPDVTLKVFGLSKLSTGLVQFTTRMRPYSLHCTVSECGMEEVNGTYGIDKSLLTSEGRLQQAVKVRYVKRRHTDMNNASGVNVLEIFASCSVAIGILSE
jgi:hypothetical protein